MQVQRCLPPIKSQDHISCEQHNAASSCEKVFSPNFPLKQWLWLYPLLFQIYFKKETRILTIKPNYFRLQFNIYEIGRAHSR